MRSPSFHDIELLTAFLDGQFKAGEIRRLESRLQAEPALRTALEGLRETRTVLRRLPQRRAPRNFMLTPRMAGVKPPLPQAYPFFRMASALAAILFFLAATTNYVLPLAAAQREPAPAFLGMGGGGAPDTQARPQSGGGCDGPDCGPAVMEAPAGTRAPAATEAPAEALTRIDTLPTGTVSLETYAAELPTPGPSGKFAPPAADQFVQRAAPPVVPAAWEFSLLGLAAVFAAAAVVVRWQVDSDFKRKQK